jgi:hypothetical protein
MQTQDNNSEKTNDQSCLSAVCALHALPIPQK